MRQHILMAAGALSLGIGTAFAQGIPGELDSDGDGQITSEEWLDYGHKRPESDPYYWGMYDADKSGGLTPEEWTSGEFARYDKNQDMVLDVGEYSARAFGLGPRQIAGEQGAEGASLADAAAQDAAATNGEAASGGLEVVDSDGSETVSSEEFAASLEGETGPGSFADYDADQSGEISGEEFLAGEFGRFDADQNDVVDLEEYGVYMADTPAQN